MTTTQGRQGPARMRAWSAHWNPLRSVRSAIIAGFGLLVLISIAVVAGSAWLVREYQTDTALMEEKADTALLLQGAESYVGTAGSDASALRR